jgi:hypothetical protein
MGPNVLLPVVMDPDTQFAHTEASASASPSGSVLHSRGSFISFWFDIFLQSTVNLEEHVAM